MTDPLPAPRRLRSAPWTFGSGAAVATLFARLFAIISLVAWLSLGAQVQLLIGSHGLLPVGELMDAVRAQPELSLRDLPTIFWSHHSDAALTAGVVVGAVLSLAALLGLRRRLCFALSVVLYLSYATVARDFLSFQWDNLLLECGFLAVFLRTDAPAPVVHFLFRVVLFKLYLESGIAKWQSPLHDWRDGSAMIYYYETAPLPTWLAFYAHHLPAWWHHFESRATLVLELVVPFGIFGPRPARLCAAAAFTLFQIANAATANYGIFCFLAAALAVFLLDDRDVERAGARLGQVVPAALRRLPPALGRLSPALRRLSGATERAERSASSPPDHATTATPRWWLARVAAAAFVLVSFAEACLHFAEPGWIVSIASPVLALDQRLRLINTYHLFAAVTRDRIEPELQTLPAREAEGDDAAWIPQQLRHKPGDVLRAPDFVAPHQPRVDFQLWFYGLSFQRREPPYVSALVDRMCEDSAAVQPLFRAPLPPAPAAVRIVYWRYQFASAAEARATGAWWRRTRVATGRAMRCNMGTLEGSPNPPAMDPARQSLSGFHASNMGTLEGSPNPSAQ